MIKLVSIHSNKFFFFENTKNKTENVSPCVTFSFKDIGLGVFVLFLKLKMRSFSMSDLQYATFYSTLF